MQKITVPKGTTITTTFENDMLVFEFECVETKPMFKRGDCYKLYSDSAELIFTFKEYGANNFIIYSTLVDITANAVISEGGLITNDSIEPCDISLLQAELSKHGKQWDAENECLIDLKWMPKDNEIVFIVCTTNSDLYQDMAFNGNMFSHQQGYEIGLIFQTKEEAIERSKEVVRFLNETKK